MKLNDQVYCECEYSEQLPFMKWNATKVKLLNAQRVAPTYLQHRMQQMIHQTNNTNMNQQQLNQQLNQQQLNQQLNQQQLNQQQLNQQQLNQKALSVAQEANFFTPEIRKLIEKQQQQQQQSAQIQNYQQSIQNNTNQQYNRQNDFNQTPPAFSGQITYTSTPGAAFVSPVLPFNQSINVQQQTLPLTNLRAFSNNPQPNSGFQKRDNLHNRNKDRDDHKNLRDNRNHRKDHQNEHRDRHRDNEKSNRDDNRRDLNRDNNRDSRDNRKNTAALRDRRNTESPSGSVNSSSTNSKPRRRYTPLNIPIHELLKSPINTYDIKRKFDQSIHIPSDFKELQINNKFELNFQSLHKPIQYRIVHSTSEKELKNEDEKDGKDVKKEKESSSSDKKQEEDCSKQQQNKKTTDELADDLKKEASSKENNENGDETTKVNDESNDKARSEKSTTTLTDKQHEEKEDSSSKTTEEKTDLSKSKKKPALPILNKYAVKVLLLSFPSMTNIYDRVIESDRDKDSYTSSSKAYFLHFNKLFSYLCLRNHNDGHSLIGGKFDAKLDGYIDENTPNLIQTAVRCVKQQTGIDLSACKKWKHMCTFLYNRDDSPFYDNASFEYSNIFIPDVWSLLDEDSSYIKTEEECSNKIVDKSTESSRSNSIKIEKLQSDSLDDNDSKIDFSNGGDSFSSLQVNPSDSIAVSDISSINNSKIENETTTNLDSTLESSIANRSIEDDSFAFSITQLNELKVTELRARLEELGHKTAKNVKKADLILKLSNILKSQHGDANNKSLDESISEEATKETDDSVIKDEKKANDDENMETSEAKNDEEKEQEEDTNSVKHELNSKRKTDEFESNTDDLTAAKRVKHEEDEDMTTSKESSKELKEVKQLESISEDGFIMAYGSNSITLLNLYQALNHNKYDHFELQIVSELIREALIGHFASYILSACYENKQLIKEQQQEDTKKEDAKEIALDNNYVLLAFSYFDSCHCGYVLSDDLLKLLSCCGINVSKRSWTNIFGSNDKIRYRFFKEPTKIYNFNLIADQPKSSNNKQQTLTTKSNEVKNTLYIKDGNVFDIDKLINQSESDEKLKVELKNKLRVAEETIRNLQSNLNESDSKQKKMTVAYKKQNDEICDNKREKEKIKYKVGLSLFSFDSPIIVMI